MKKILIIAIMFISAFGLQAQENTKNTSGSDNKIMIGLEGSTTYGTGLSFKTIRGNNGVSLTFLPMFESRDGNLDQSFNVGLSYNYYFRRNDFIDFSMKVGGQYRGGNVNHFSFSNGRDEVRTNIDLGIGPEINIHLFPELDLEVNLGYGLYEITDGLNSSLSAGIGLHYNIYR